MKPFTDGGKEFTLQTIIRNLKWLDEATLVAINVVIVNHAHLAIGVPSSGKLRGRADSFIVGTDVEHPIDFRLLADGLLTLIRLISKLCGKHASGSGEKRRDISGNCGANSTEFCR